LLLQKKPTAAVIGRVTQRFTLYLYTPKVLFQYPNLLTCKVSLSFTLIIIENEIMTNKIANINFKFVTGVL